MGKSIPEAKTLHGFLRPLSYQLKGMMIIEF
jgi:hypothetical protein